MSRNMNSSADRLVEALARRIEVLRLQAPAAVLLEAHKPLGFVASQFMLLCQPILDVVFPHDASTELAALMQDRCRLDDLIDRLTMDQFEGGG
jgi:hypothetical protein